MSPRPLALVACCAAALALAGCSGSPHPAPTTTVTVPGPTVTATVTPPPRAPEDALIALDAWSLCSAAVQTAYGVPDTKYSPYASDSVSRNPDGSFTVTVGFQPPGNGTPGAQGVCTVSGTVGSPVVSSPAFTDFG